MSINLRKEGNRIARTDIYRSKQDMFKGKSPYAHHALGWEI